MSNPSHQSIPQGGCSSFCSQPTDWKGLPDDWLLPRNASLQDCIKMSPQQLDKQRCSALFREAIQKSLDYNCSDCFVALTIKHSQYFREELSDPCWTDLIWAYRNAARQRSHFISIIFEKKIQKEEDCFQLDELKIVIDVAIKNKCWGSLPDLFCIKDGCSGNLFRQIGKCAMQILSDESSQPHVIPILDQWIKNQKGSQVVALVIDVQKKMDKEPCSDSAVSRAKQWCVDNGHANLALVLALVTKDWVLVENLLPSVNVHYNTLLKAAELAANPTDEGGSFSACAAILEACPINEELIDFLSMFCHEPLLNKGLSRVYEEQDRWDLALVIQYRNPDFLSNCHMYCENRSVLDWILKRSVPYWNDDQKGIDLFLALLQGCTEEETLRDVLHTVVSRGIVKITEVLLSRVDISKYILDRSNNSLLFSALSGWSNGAEKRKMVHLLLAAGLSPFQRETITLDRFVHPAGNHFPFNCPLKFSFRKNHPEIVDLTLDCRAYSNKTLYEVANDAKIQRLAKKSKRLKTCFERVQEAAHSPPRLEELTRLAVSHSIGCQPGRSERIDRLPLPTVLKDAVKFNDVLHLNTQTASYYGESIELEIPGDNHGAELSDSDSDESEESHSDSYSDSDSDESEGSHSDSDSEKSYSDSDSDSESDETVWAEVNLDGFYSDSESKSDEVDSDGCD